MNEIERAISEISDIRSQLAASTRFRGYAPEAVAMVGVLSLAVLLAQTVWPARLAANNAQIALVWGLVLLVSGAVIGIEAVSRARHRHGGMAAAMLRGAGLTAVPIGFAGLVIGVAVLVFAPELAWVLPGAWQMLVGVVGLGSHATLPRGILWPGLWYMVSGALVCLLSGLRQEITPAMAGIPFIIAHFAIAWSLHKEGDSPR